MIPRFSPIVTAWVMNTTRETRRSGPCLMLVIKGWRMHGVSQTRRNCAVLRIHRLDVYLQLACKAGASISLESPFIWECENSFVTPRRRHR